MQIDRTSRMHGAPYRIETWCLGAGLPGAVVGGESQRGGRPVAAQSSQHNRCKGPGLPCPHSTAWWRKSESKCLCGRAGGLLYPCQRFRAHHLSAGQPIQPCTMDSGSEQLVFRYAYQMRAHGPMLASRIVSATKHIAPGHRRTLEASVRSYNFAVESALRTARNVPHPCLQALMCQQASMMAIRDDHATFCALCTTVPLVCAEALVVSDSLVSHMRK